MILDFLILAAGLVTLVIGGEMLVRGASSLARRLGIPPMIIGLTVVAFGTSAPELAVSLSAAISGSGDIAFGNVVGSNICNVALLLGITALISPLAVHSDIVVREIPMMILATAATVVLSLDSAFGPDVKDVLTRGDGVVLLLFFSVFIYYTARGALRRGRGDALVEEVQAGSHGPTPQTSGLVAALLIGGGLLGLGLGAHYFVDAAVSIARAIGVSEIVIGITIVAVGTSLPELVTCLIAARRGEADIAVGNIVGSNIFNLLFVLAVTATIRPVRLPAGSTMDLAAMLVIALAMMPIVMKTHRVTRIEGALLLASYVGFAAWQVIRW